MIEFNCTVKDIFRRPNMIDKAVRRLADNGYTGFALTYARIRENMFNAMAYAADRLKPHEYEVAARYLGSRLSEQSIADASFYTHRTIRRYISKTCSLIEEYYLTYFGIRLLPNDTRSVDCLVAAGSIWDKINQLMNKSIENACIAILCCLEHESVNSVCNSYNVGSNKVKKIMKAFDSAVTVIDIPVEKRSAV